VKIDWTTYHARVGNAGRSQWTRGQEWGHTLEPPGRKLKTFTLAIFLAGSGRMRCRHGWIPLRPGVCTWGRPGHPYVARQDPEDPLSHFFVEFELVNARGGRLAHHAPLPPEFIEPPDPEFAEVTMRRIVELCFGFAPMGVAIWPHGDGVARLADAMLTALLMELDTATDSPADPGSSARPQSHYVRLIRQAILRITANPREMPSVAKLARQSRYSVSRFSRIFKLVAGESPEQFMVHTRLRRAERMLCETDMPVGEVALASGYRDIYFFSHQFKQFNRISPTRFRRQHAKPPRTPTSN
jgi:AraC-like DNA-binding protein